MHLCVCVFHVVFSTRTLNISYNAVKKNTLLKILKIIEGNFMSDFALELSHILSYIDYAYLSTSFHFLSFFLSFRYVYVCVACLGVYLCVCVCRGERKCFESGAHVLSWIGDNVGFSA